jgi:hypothetical protein
VYSGGGVRNLPPIDRGAWVTQEYNTFDLDVGDSAALIVATGTPLAVRGEAVLLFAPINNHYSANRYEQMVNLPLQDDWFDVIVNMVAGLNSEIQRSFLFRLERIPYVSLNFVREII